MRFEYSRAECAAGETCWLLTNGLGGYMSTTAAFSVDRCDTGLLVAAEGAANRRATLVHRLSETLQVEGRSHFLSTQAFGDGTLPEDGCRYLEWFVVDGIPEWRYQVGAVTITRRCGMAHGQNAAGVVYQISNGSPLPCTLRVEPVFLFAPKGEAPGEPPPLRLEGNTVCSGGRQVTIRTNSQWEPGPVSLECLSYRRDAREGRASAGFASRCGGVTLSVPAGGTGTLDLAFSDRPDPPTGGEIVEGCARRQRELREHSPFRHPAARELAGSAHAYLVRRDLSGGHTVIAGYPFFGDWGRDTMIALPGCALATGRFAEAKSILRTFLAHERDGLVPNLFPDGESEPMYNTADAALLLINALWLYYQKTGDADFVREGWPVLRRIVDAYRAGTAFGIGMDEDGLIRAGAGLDQVTWMDVRIGDHLPTPRHGKPVEINAYWYNALRILRELAPLAGVDGEEYGSLAERVKESFNRQFWMEDRGYLRDVLSGGPADTQLRCNQIWAVSMPFTMLPPHRERLVVETVFQKLYTPRGLRTLSPDDPEFHPVYAGGQRERDLAYHQGTVWPFPLGGFYLAWLKVHGGTPKAAGQVERMLEPMEGILREGCAGQLPEVYDGLHPAGSKGCFAQGWSVGELLRVYEEIERIQNTEAR